MKPEIVNQLLEINSLFYREQAASFSTSRQHLQPGVRQIMDRLLKEKPVGHLLDLGCGNGLLGRYLQLQNYQGSYLGLDASPELLSDAQKGSQYPFMLADLSRPDWDLAIPQAPFDAILAFSVLHHIPGDDLRLRLLDQIRNHLIRLKGYLVHSEWQFQNSSRLADHMIPLDTIGVKASDLDSGDAILDWRAGKNAGLRYVHFFSEDELESLAKKVGFLILDSFYSDGKEGNLGLYQVWRTV